MLLPFILVLVIVFIVLICSKTITIQNYAATNPAEVAMVAARQAKQSIDPQKTKALARKAATAAIQAQLLAEHAKQKAEITRNPMDYVKAKNLDKKAKDAVFASQKAMGSIEKVSTRCDREKANSYLSKHIPYNMPFQSQIVHGCGVRGYYAGALDKGQGYKLCGTPAECFRKAKF
jgi:FKBP-type peptidyl-prolyl cis-trans isomerase